MGSGDTIWRRSRRAPEPSLFEARLTLYPGFVTLKKHTLLWQLDLDNG